MNMVVIEAMINSPRIQRFWMRWPAPGINHPIAGAMTDILWDPASAAFDVAFGEFAIQMITSSL
jgi:hypothetical protein